jgi:hypothetical protein
VGRCACKTDKEGEEIVNLDIERIEKEDPTVLKVFIAEYYFLKKDIQKAFDLFTEAYATPGLSPVMKETVRNYLVIASRELRKKELEGIDFEIGYSFSNEKETVDSKITKATFKESIAGVGMLLEILDYYLKKNQQAEK